MTFCLLRARSKLVTKGRLQIGCDAPGLEGQCLWKERSRRKDKKQEQAMQTKTAVKSQLARFEAH